MPRTPVLRPAVKGTGTVFGFSLSLVPACQSPISAVRKKVPQLWVADRSFPKASAKVRTFLLPTKSFANFFQKKCIFSQNGTENRRKRSEKRGKCGGRGRKAGGAATRSRHRGQEDTTYNKVRARGKEEEGKEAEGSGGDGGGKGGRKRREKRKERRRRHKKREHDVVRAP